MELDSKILQKVENIEIPKDEDPPEYRVIAYLFAGGAEPKVIATMLKMNLESVHSVIELPRISSFIAELKKKSISGDALKTIKSYLPDAVEVTRSIMMDSNQKGMTRLTAANTFLDRGMGKPTQTIEVGGSLIRELFERLDSLEAQEKAKTINIEAKKVIEKDPLDSWIEENL